MSLCWQAAGLGRYPSMRGSCSDHPTQLRLVVTLTCPWPLFVHHHPSLRLWYNHGQGDMTNTFTTHQFFCTVLQWTSLYWWLILAWKDRGINRYIVRLVIFVGQNFHGLGSSNDFVGLYFCGVPTLIKYIQWSLDYPDFDYPNSFKTNTTIKIFISTL